MKLIQVAEDILPIGEFKTHASEVVRKLREHGRPVVDRTGLDRAVLH